jgi:hypothetical protein
VQRPDGITDARRQLSQLCKYLMLHTSYQAPPIPSMPRPREMTSSVVTISVRIAGLRQVTPVTSVPSCTRRAWAVSAPSSVSAASIG